MTRNQKDWFQYVLAAIMVISGAILSYLSFFLSGDVQGGVLTYVGIAVTFAGAIFGLAVYTKEKYDEIYNDLRKYIDDNKKK